MYLRSWRRYSASSFFSAPPLSSEPSSHRSASLRRVRVHTRRECETARACLQVNEIVASQAAMSKELDKILEAYFSIQPRWGRVGRRDAGFSHIQCAVAASAWEGSALLPCSRVLGLCSTIT